VYFLNKLNVCQGERRAIKAMNKDQIDDKEALENELMILKQLVKIPYICRSSRLGSSQHRQVV